MLAYTAYNRENVRRIASALGEMNEQAVFVGGATIGMYINDPAADDVRPTKDVDISFAIASLGDLELVREELIRKGFTQSSEDDVISYLKEQFRRILDDSVIHEAILSNLPYDTREERYRRIIDCIKQIVSRV